MNSGALTYNRDLINVFMVTTTYLGTTFNQILNIDVNPYLYETPIPMVGCRVPSLCLVSGSYRRIAPSNDIIIEAKCAEGCTTADTIFYNYTIFKNIGTSTNFNWLACNQIELSNAFGIFV